MPAFYSFLNNPTTSGELMSLMASRIQNEAEQSETTRNAGGGAIVIEIDPAMRSPHDPPRSVNATLDVVYRWLGVPSSGNVSISRTYDLLPHHGRYVTEDDEIVDCESVAHGKIATLKRVRLENPKEYASFAATDLPGDAGCGYIALHGAVVFIVKDESGNRLMDIYIAVSGSPFDEEDEALALEARGVLEETLVRQFGCQLFGVGLPEPSDSSEEEDEDGEQAKE